MAKSPFLRRVSIHGFKSIVSCDVKLEPLTIFVGANGSGKSNFFEALAFIKDVMETNLAEAVRRHGGWDSITSKLIEGGPITFELEIGLYSDTESASSREFNAPDQVKFGFSIAKEVSDTPYLVGEWFSIFNGQGSEKIAYRYKVKFNQKLKSFDYDWNINHPDITNDKVPVMRRDRLWIDSLGTQPFLWVSDSLRFMAFYNFQTQTIRRPQKATPGELLSTDGRNLASSIETVRGLDETVIERVQQYLRKIVSEIDGFKVVRSGDFESVRFQLTRREAGKPLEFDASSMSDGTLRVLASLMAAFQIHRPYGPSIVGIEEPETALHPAAMRALVSALDEATLRTQILLTTHSPDLLNAEEIKPEQVRVVQMIDGHTIIGPVDPASVEIVRKKLDTLGGLEQQNQLEPVVEGQETMSLMVPVE